jgi:radical SAM protein with 4Fe4S-binding SPASM domain
LPESERMKPHQFLLVELTKSCQNDCVFCYNVWKEDEDYPKEELSAAEMITLLDKVIGESGCKVMALTGGEPLLKKDFLKIASFISSRGITPVLISNGKLLTERMVEDCMGSGINHFEVSLHSHDEAVHDRLAGRRGSFDEVLDAVLNVKKLGGQVNTIFVATKENIGAFKNFVELNALLRVDWILFNRVACGGTCLESWKSLAPSPADIEHALDEGAPLAEKYKIGLSAGVQIQPCLVDLSKYENVASAFCPLNEAPQGHTYFAIDPAGNLRMCNRSKDILGNLLEEPFDSISRSDVVKKFCKAIPEFCFDCKLARECAGGCKADAVSCYGTPSRPDPFIEKWKDRVKKIK